MKVVLDSNIFLSGLMLPKSQPGKILSAWRSSAFELVLSEPMLIELTRVLAYPKIRKRIAWSDEEIDHFITLLRFKATIVSIEGVDAPVLAALIASDADCLVSGDQDLLCLNEQYPIETVAQFVKRL